MKSILKSIFTLFFVVLVIGCSNDHKIDVNSGLEEVKSFESSVSARSFVESNQELRVQIDPTDPVSVKSLNDTEIAKLKAALYRFYSTVELKEGEYYTPLEKPKEINLSQELFTLLKGNLEQMNRGIDEIYAKEGNNEHVVQPITPEYLESLLE